MKFLADVNVERKIIETITQHQYDVKWIPEYDASITDEDLLDLANQEQRILITNDKDFGELVFRQQSVTSGIILLRIKGQDVLRKITLVKKLLRDHSDRLLRHFVVISDNKIRIIPLEEQK